MSEKNSDNPLLDVATASELCALSRSAFYKLVRDGLAPKPIKLGRASRWRRQELLDWIAAGCPESEAFKAKCSRK